MPKHRQGGKFTGSHTTVTDFAGTIADIVAPLASVSKVSIGIIKHAPGRRSGNHHVKVKVDGHSLLLTILQNHTAQELRLIGGNPSAMKTDACRAIAKAGYTVNG